MLSTTIYSASVLISSALLPQLQGALSATQDEISWVMTFNIVATAVATPAAGWLADRFGQRATMTWCALLFAVATFMCGASNSLEELIGWRIVQGAAGAPLVPIGQTILLDAFPRRQHGAVISIYGMANMIGPSLGPMFAGQIAESLGWRWGFWMVVPVAHRRLHRQLGGAAARRPGAGAGARLDWLGLPQPVGRHRRGAAGVLARAAARLVRQLRDHHRDARSPVSRSMCSAPTASPASARSCA